MEDYVHLSAENKLDMIKDILKTLADIDDFNKYKCCLVDRMVRVFGEQETMEIFAPQPKQKPPPRKKKRRAPLPPPEILDAYFPNFKYVKEEVKVDKDPEIPVINIIDDYEYPDDLNPFGEDEEDDKYKEEKDEEETDNKEKDKKDIHSNEKKENKNRKKKSVKRRITKFFRSLTFRRKWICR